MMGISFHIVKQHPIKGCADLYGVYKDVPEGHLASGETQIPPTYIKPYQLIMVVKYKEQSYMHPNPLQKII